MARPLQQLSGEFFDSFEKSTNYSTSTHALAELPSDSDKNVRSDTYELYIQYSYLSKEVLNLETRLLLWIIRFEYIFKLRPIQGRINQRTKWAKPNALKQLRALS